MAVDTLAASPFALLDKRTSLRFVTDVVHEGYDPVIAQAPGIISSQIEFFWLQV
jgi:hypothetical protein